jgi:hypothetical protein
MRGRSLFVVRCSSFVVRLNLSSDDDRGIPFLRKEYAGMGHATLSRCRAHGAAQLLCPLASVRLSRAELNAGG